MGGGFVGGLLTEEAFDHRRRLLEKSCIRIFRKSQEKKEKKLFPFSHNFYLDQRFKTCKEVISLQSSKSCGPRVNSRGNLKKCEGDGTRRKC